MGFKSIAVVVTDKSRDLHALSLAIAMAQHESAHLDIFCVGVDPVRYTDMPNGGIVMMDAGHEEAAAQSRALGDWARLTLPLGLDRVTVQSVVIGQLGFDIEVAGLLRYADLVVAAKPYAKGRSGWQVAALDAALYGTGAPVLIAPDRKVTLDAPFDRMMIGWDESDEALAAVRKALPMLRRAKRVDVVMVGTAQHSPERSDPGGLLSLFLSRHGLRCDVSVLVRNVPRVADVLMRFARENGVSAIVMGAYGHSRLREALLGGVTRDMLESLDLPVLMAR